MYNALKSVKRMKKITKLIIIQLALGIAMLNTLLNIQDNATSKYDTFTNMFDVENTYLVRMHANNNVYNDFDTTLAIQNEIANKLYELKDLNEVNEVYSCFNGFVNKDIKELGKEEYKIRDKSGSVFHDGTMVNLVIDENFFKHYSFSSDGGRSFTEEDFNKDYKKENIPIMIGSDYKDNIKIGDTFNETKYYDEYDQIEDKITFEVVGYIKDNSLVSFVNKTNLFDAVKFSNSLMVTPNVKKCDWYFNIGIALNDVGMFIELKDGSDFKSVEAEIQSIISEFEEVEVEAKPIVNNFEVPEGEAQPIIQDVNLENQEKISFKYFNLKEDMGVITLNLKNNVNNTLLMGIALTLLSVIGIITAMLGEIRRRKKEFGIRLASGASIKILCKEMILEVMVMISIAVVFANLFLYLTDYSYFLKLSLVFKNIVFIFILTMIVSVIPVLNLKKNNVVDLIKGDVK